MLRTLDSYNLLAGEGMTALRMLVIGYSFIATAMYAQVSLQSSFQQLFTEAEQQITTGKPYWHQRPKLILRFKTLYEHLAAHAPASISYLGSIYQQIADLKDPAILRPAELRDLGKLRPKLKKSILQKFADLLSAQSSLPAHIKEQLRALDLTIFDCIDKSYTPTRNLRNSSFEQPTSASSDIQLPAPCPLPKLCKPCGAPRSIGDIQFQLTPIEICQDLARIAQVINHAQKRDLQGSDNDTTRPQKRVHFAPATHN